MSRIESTEIDKTYLFIENRDKMTLQKLEVKPRTETNEIKNCNEVNNEFAAVKI